MSIGATELTPKPNQGIKLNLTFKQKSTQTSKPKNRKLTPEGHILAMPQDSCNTNQPQATNPNVIQHQPNQKRN
jgi:hypothetical protein